MPMMTINEMCHNLSNANGYRFCEQLKAFCGSWTAAPVLSLSRLSINIFSKPSKCDLFHALTGCCSLFTDIQTLKHTHTHTHFVMCFEFTFLVFFFLLFLTLEGEKVKKSKEKFQKSLLFSLIEWSENAGTFSFALFPFPILFWW